MSTPHYVYLLFITTLSSTNDDDSFIPKTMFLKAFSSAHAGVNWCAKNLDVDICDVYGSYQMPQYTISFESFILKNLDDEIASDILSTAYPYRINALAYYPTLVKTPLLYSKE